VPHVTDMDSYKNEFNADQIKALVEYLDSK
jgi:hypothetical protein